MCSLSECRREVVGVLATFLVTTQAPAHSDSLARTIYLVALDHAVLHRHHPVLMRPPFVFTVVEGRYLIRSLRQLQIAVLVDSWVAVPVDSWVAVLVES